MANHLFTQKDIRLQELPQIFSASALWLEEGMQDIIGTFDVVIRDMPNKRNFMLFGGLDEAIDNFMNWKYSDEEIQHLLENGVITPKFAEYLRNFKFTGDVWAMKEGTVMFPGEPIIRITAPMIEANLFTNFLLCVVSGNTKFFTKAIRPVLAAGNKKVLGPGTARSESFESGLKCVRACYAAGFIGTETFQSFCRKYNLPTSILLTIAYHAVIKSFPTELEAMRKAASLFKNGFNTMVDTYDFDEGMKNAIILAKEMKERGQTLHITIDSGDLYELSVKARRMLDDAGLTDTKITVASNLDEYKVKEMQDKNAPVDVYLVGTEISCVSDAPVVETVYKIAEKIDGDKTEYCAKLAPGKESYPGRKQVFRTFEDGKMVGDVIGLEDENFGEPLLVKIVENGELVAPMPSLNEIRDYVKEQVEKLPEHLKEINTFHKFPVKISDKLQAMFDDIKSKHVCPKDL